MPVPKYVKSDSEYKQFRICCDCRDGCKPGTCGCMALTYEGHAATIQFSKIKNKLKKQIEQNEITQEQYKRMSHT